MTQTGASIIVDALCRNGVKTVFGYPGGAVLPLYEELYRNQHRLEHILCAHEQNAVHAADGFARASGRPGVVIATSGPGASNLVTGIATAFLDSVPLVVITGNVSVHLQGKDSFQELDTVSLTRSIVKHNFDVASAEELSGIIDAAFFIACDGRPGPVVIDIPQSVQKACCESCDFREPLFFSQAPSPVNLKPVAELIAQSRRPLIYAGGGVVAAGVFQELEMLAEKMDAPVTFSMMGLSAMGADHPRNAGMCGMHGTLRSAQLLKECDLLLALGVRFSDRAVGDTEAFRKNKKIIQIDIDRSEINKNVKVDAAVTGDLKELLPQLLRELSAEERPSWREYASSFERSEPAPDPTRLTPRTLIGTVAKHLEEDCLIATDVGQHQMWTMQYFPFKKPRTLLSSGGLGTMGYGLGAAIGGSVARGGKRTVLFTGDGSFGMSLQELATAVSQKLPLLICIFNNGVLGMVRQWQNMFYQQHYSHTTLNRQTDFAALAQAFGAKGVTVNTPDELEHALAGLPCDRPAVLDCRLDQDEFVLPMIPPGGSVEDMISSKEEF